MALDHADSAATITPKTARTLVSRSSRKGLRLLVLFARHQLLRFDDLLGEFDTTQNGLNALLGCLTREFQRIQKDAGFYIYLPEHRSWAIGHASAVNLRRALRVSEKERQRKIDF